MQVRRLLLTDIPQPVHLLQDILPPHRIGKDINSLNHGRHQPNHHRSRILGKPNILNNNPVNHRNGKYNLNNMIIYLVNGTINTNNGIKIDLEHHLQITLLLHNLLQPIITEVV